jgi:dTDP-4-dehydrorhamnose 3,5-epimerase
MQIQDTDIADVKILIPKVFGDERGFFLESFNDNVFSELLGIGKRSFVQDNHSRSCRGVLRGLHYQLKNTQGKLVRCVQGEIYDVAVDIRKSSKTFGKWVGVHLSSENKHILWVPEGFAHGFVVVSDTAEVLYKTTAFYDPSSERSILWNDPALNIQWPLNITPSLSKKDSEGQTLTTAEVFS